MHVRYRNNYVATAFQVISIGFTSNSNLFGTVAHTTIPVSYILQGIWDVQGDGESKMGCVLRVYVNVNFSKKTMFRGIRLHLLTLNLTSKM